MTNTNNSAFHNIITYNVSPSLIKSDTRPEEARVNVITSLIGIAPFEQIRISGDTIEMTTNPDTNMGMQEINAKAAVEMGFGSTVSLKGSGNGRYFLQSYLAYVDHTIEQPQGIIVSERYGMGVRIMVKAWNLTTTTSISLGSIAADCTLKGASSSVQIETIGLNGADIISSISQLSAISVSNLDTGSLHLINSIFQDIINYIHEQIADDDKRKILKPELVSVELDLDRIKAAYKNSASTLLGLTGIERGLSYEETLEKKPDVNDLPDIVCDDYEGQRKNCMDDCVIYNMYQALNIHSSKPTYPQQTAGKKSNFRGDK